MDLRFTLVLGLVAMLIVVTGLAVFLLMAFSDDLEEGVAAPHLSPQREVELREAALRRIAERQNHQQRQRDASARLTRGF